MLVRVQRRVNLKMTTITLSRIDTEKPTFIKKITVPSKEIAIELLMDAAFVSNKDYGDWRRWIWGNNTKGKLIEAEILDENPIIEALKNI